MPLPELPAADRSCSNCAYHVPEDSGCSTRECDWQESVESREERYAAQAAKLEAALSHYAEARVLQLDIDTPEGSYHGPALLTGVIVAQKALE